MSEDAQIMEVLAMRNRSFSEKKPVYVHDVDMSGTEGATEDGTPNTGYRRWARMHQEAGWVYGILAPLTGVDDIRHMFSGVVPGEDDRFEDFCLSADPDALTVAYRNPVLPWNKGRIEIYSDRLTADQIETALIVAMEEQDTK